MFLTTPRGCYRASPPVDRQHAMTEWALFNRPASSLNPNPRTALLCLKGRVGRGKSTRPRSARPYPTDWLRCSTCWRKARRGVGN